MRRITGTLREDLHVFTIISRLILLRMRNVSDKVVENLKTHVLCSVTFSLEYGAIYDRVWKNIVDPDSHRWQYGACDLHAG